MPATSSLVPSIVYPSDMTLRAPGMPASFCSDCLLWVAKRRWLTAASTAAAQSSPRNNVPKHPVERGGRAVCHGAAPFETESTKTPRGTLAFDDAAQAALRNHRGRVHMNVDVVTLRAFLATPNQSILQCLFIQEVRGAVSFCRRSARNQSSAPGRRAHGDWGSERVLVAGTGGGMTNSLTRATPASMNPSCFAAWCDRSIIRPFMKGPRSLIRTTTCAPVSTLVTLTIVPNARVR
jgi:hypothetical protein